MEKNIGKIDRIARVAVGLVFVSLGWLVFKNNWLGILFNVAGGLSLLSSVTGHSFIYAKIGISTLKKQSAPAGINKNFPVNNFPTQTPLSS